MIDESEIKRTVDLPFSPEDVAAGRVAASTKLTEAERHLMEHALGIAQSGRAYRNYYTCAPGSPDFERCRSLVERGMVADYGPVGSRSTRLFYVTDAGEAALRR